MREALNYSIDLAVCLQFVSAGPKSQIFCLEAQHSAKVYYSTVRQWWHNSCTGPCWWACLASRPGSRCAGLRMPSAQVRTSVSNS